MDMIKAMHRFFSPHRRRGLDRRGHPRRAEDRWQRRAERFWMGVTAALWIWTAVSLGSQSREQTKQRYEGTAQRCQLARAVLGTAIDLGVPPSTVSLQKLRENIAGCERIKTEIGKELDPNDR